MGCESCAVAFSVWRRRRACPECGRGVCAACLRRGAGLCASCRALSARPLIRAHIAHLKARDLQAFLQRQNVSFRGCLEKEELITLCLSHVNSGAYRKPTVRVSSMSGTFNTLSSLRGLTSNINDFINNTFDLRSNQNSAGTSQQARASAPTADGSSCHNSRHAHAPGAPTAAPPAAPTTAPPAAPPTAPTAPPPPPPHRPTAPSQPFPWHNTRTRTFTSWASNLPRHPPPPPRSRTGAGVGVSLRVAAAAAASTDAEMAADAAAEAAAEAAEEAAAIAAVAAAEAAAEAAAAAEVAHVDTRDCFEIEDVEDAGWEFVERAADPLPNDSEVLMTVNERPALTIEEPRSSIDASPHNESQPSPTLSPGDQTTQEDLILGVQQENSQMSRDEPPDDAGIRVTEMVDGDSAEASGSERDDNNDQGSTLRPPSFAHRLAGSDDSAPQSPQRAASSLELRWTEATEQESRSLHEEPTTTYADPVAAVQLESLASEAAVLALSVRQLKELLVRNRVEIRGCVERAELQQRAAALWRDHTKWREQLESLPLEECCKICMAAPLECVLLECGHMATCTACARLLAECPICRRYVSRAVRFFRS